MTKERTSVNWAPLLLLATLAWLLYLYSPLIAPLVIAALLAYLLNPLVGWFKARLKLSQTWVAALVFIAFLLLAALALTYLVPLVVRQARLLSSQLDAIQVQLALLGNQLSDLTGFQLPLEQLYFELQTEGAQFFQPERIFRVLITATTNGVWLLIVLVASFYLLRDGERLRLWFLRLAPERLQPDLNRLHAEIAQVWAIYLRGQLMLMIAIGLLSGLGAAAVGLRSAALVGVLAGTLAIIPSLGPAIATALAAALAWLGGSTYLNISNLWFALLVCAIFIGVQLLESIWLSPQWMGRRLHLHPGLVFLAVVSTLTILGATAALIIVPLIGSAEVLLRYTRARLLGAEPWPAPKTPAAKRGKAK